MPPAISDSEPPPLTDTDNSSDTSDRESYRPPTSSHPPILSPGGTLPRKGNARVVLPAPEAGQNIKKLAISALDWSKIHRQHKEWLSRHGAALKPGSKRKNAAKVEIGVRSQEKVHPVKFHESYQQLLTHCLRGEVQQHISPVDLYTLRLNYYDPLYSSFAQRRALLFGQLKDAFNPHTKEFSFRFAGVPLCASCFFRHVYGLSHGTTTSLIKDFQEKRFSLDHGNEGNGGRPTTPASLAFRAWLAEYVETLGSPDSQAETTPVPVFLPPFGQKKDVIVEYQHEMKVRGEKALDMNYCYHIWSQDFPHVHIPKAVKFNKCDECVDNQDKILQTKVKSEIAQLKEDRKQHYEFVRKEKLAYYRFRELALEANAVWLVVIIDGMDQAKTELPSFVQTAHRDGGEDTRLKVRVCELSLACVCMCGYVCARVWCACCACVCVSVGISKCFVVSEAYAVVQMFVACSGDRLPCAWSHSQCPRVFEHRI